MNDKAIEKVVLEKYIVSTAENQVLFVFENIGANQFFKFLNLIDFGEISCHGMEAEAVVRL